MRTIIALVLCAAALAGCKPDNSNDITGSISCANKLYSPYNPKDMKQCVSACITCDRGVMTTCTTACTLKGAR